MCLFFIEISFTLGAGEERRSILNGLRPFEHPHQSMNHAEYLKMKCDDPGSKETAGTLPINQYKIILSKQFTGDL
jgi:hypothetical protein